ncbi:MAG TPA: PASTA domain-containing protein [Miltoncostaeaceae bacterium]|nr:PASTA domain-containing protein [Miltoncostaeaceae bacterium]
MRATAGDVVAGRYRLDRLVEVDDGRRAYRATDLRRDQAVELWMPDGDPPDPAAVAALRAEGEALAACAGPGVAAVVERCEWDGVPVLVTECVPGTSIAQKVRAEAPLRGADAAQAVRIGLGLVDVLAGAVCARDGGPRMVHRSAVVQDDRVVVTGLRPAPPGPEAADPAVAAVCATLFVLLTAREPGEPPEMPPNQAREVPRGLRAAVEDGLAGRITGLADLRAALTREVPRAAAGSSGTGWGNREIAVYAGLAALVVVLLLGLLSRCGGGDPPGDGSRAAEGGLALAEVPRVTGLRRDRAESEAQAAGFRTSVQQEPHPEAPAGEVIRQAPDPGDEAPVGSLMAIWVSDGPPGVSVPDVRGRPLSGARAQLGAEGLRIGRLRERASSAREGEVLAQIPAPRTRVPAGTEVVLVLSAG